MNMSHHRINDVVTVKKSSKFLKIHLPEKASYCLYFNIRFKLKFHAQSVFFWAHELMNSCAYVKNQFLSLLNRAYQSIKTRLRSDIDVINAQIEI